jgi:hypothetical protein
MRLYESAVKLEPVANPSFGLINEAATFQGLCPCLQVTKPTLLGPLERNNPNLPSSGPSREVLSPEDGSRASP